MNANSCMQQCIVSFTSYKVAGCNFVHRAVKRHNVSRFRATEQLVQVKRAMWGWNNTEKYNLHVPPKKQLKGMSLNPPHILNVCVLYGTHLNEIT